jgi:uncharacterized repeat protein (TIGR03803 family)
MAKPGRRWGWILGMTLRGITTLALAIVATLSAQAQTFSDLYDFADSSDGAWPYGGLVGDQLGDLYGAAQRGGIGYGVVFKLSLSGGTWTETVLHTFAGPPTDGSYPTAGLLRDKAGNLYGTTALGGQNSAGTVFKLDIKGNETVLYNFVGGTTDGCDLTGALIRDASGNFYGTTTECGNYGFGSVFKLDHRGTETLLHSFAGPPADGATPEFGKLVLDKSGNLYGVSVYGGSNRTCLIVNNGHCVKYDDGHGTLYRLSTSGTSFTVLQSFGANNNHSGDGFPMGTPIMDADGNIYGTSYGCDPNSCSVPGFFVGAVWEMIGGGTYKVLHSFVSNSAKGANPIAGVIGDSKGNLYGTTEYGGWLCSASGCRPDGPGTVFKLAKNLSFNMLFAFADSEGAYPVASLIDSKGDLYGTTIQGGTSDNGVVFEVTLSNFEIAESPTSANVTPGQRMTRTSTRTIHP